MSIPSPSLSPRLDRLRGVRAVGAWLFVALVLLVSAERRLSEAHYNYMSSAPGLERTDLVDGDEIKIRLVLDADTCVPSLGVVPGVVVFWLPVRPVERRILPTLDENSPRASPRALHA